MIGRRKPGAAGKPAKKSWQEDEDKTPEIRARSRSPRRDAAAAEAAPATAPATLADLEAVQVPSRARREISFASTPEFILFSSFFYWTEFFLRIVS